MVSFADANTPCTVADKDIDKDIDSNVQVFSFRLIDSVSLKMGDLDI